MEIKIVLALKEDGQLLLDAPFENKILCYGMLEMAKEIILKFEPSAIIKPDLKVKIKK